MAQYNGYTGGYQQRNPQSQRNVQQPLQQKPYKALDKLTYVNEAENIIKNLRRDKFGNISLKPNQIRIILDIINEVYMKVKNDNKSNNLSEDIQSKIQYSKIKIAYQAGRDDTVKELVENSDLLRHLDNIGDNKQKMILLAHYMEALVAYHKYYSAN